MRYHIKKKGDLVIIFVQKTALYVYNEHIKGLLFIPQKDL